MSKYKIKKAKDTLVGAGMGYAVYKNGRRIEVAMGEPNWFPTKKEAVKFKKECQLEGD